ncbi:hypothetical protein DFJ43DRAFT_1162677 [Lentinula guzmanii]|uniref:Uncharacterized protein n=1 Tax=Lentinula guzmanii TaxID=2804957 RepID=A0AA38JRP4_9AGAR|nr:hypothetical protein DFJ43DRAFT_1162677 [Lentinula guzmanii]
MHLSRICTLIPTTDIIHANNVILPPDDVEDDIQAHTEKIRQERQEKQAKQAEAEPALTREVTLGGSRKGENFPLVGNLIGEDYVNYILMYNMLTGIRIKVSISDDTDQH